MPTRLLYLIAFFAGMTSPGLAQAPTKGAAPVKPSAEQRGKIRAETAKLAGWPAVTVWSR